MRLLTLYAAASCAALFFAANNDGGSKADPVDKADPAPHPLAAGEGGKTPAEPQADPAVGGPGNAPNADPSPPTKAPKGKGVVMVWAQAGHPSYGVGQMLRLPKDVGETLRAAGRARFASEAEVKAAADGQIQDVPGA